MIKNNFSKTIFFLANAVLFFIFSFISNKTLSNKIFIICVVTCAATLIIGLICLANGIYLKTREINQKSVNRHATGEGHHLILNGEDEYMFHPNETT